ncbi:MAG: 16S rRNA pseudouridine(516) synthase, partial [Pseudomonadota bacterium]
KYHQVKRMLAAVGNKVVELHREKIADITLDENLASGEYRAITEAELKL